MDKKSFVNNINFEDKTIISSIYDKIILAEKCGRTICTNEFLPPVLWGAILKVKNQFSIDIEAYGVFPEAERRMLFFTSAPIEEYPVHILKITNKSHFHDLSHRDYLGSVMALGIKREKLGDFVVDGNECYVPVFSDISEYIKLNLQSIGKCPCDVKILDNEIIEMPSIQLEDMMVISTSARIDCVISALCNVSRSQAVEFIDRGKVLINHEPVLERDRTMVENSIITVRGYGKFKYCNIEGTTSKGRLKIKIQKYK